MNRRIAVVIVAVITVGCGAGPQRSQTASIDPELKKLGLFHVSVVMLMREYKTSVDHAVKMRYTVEQKVEAVTLLSRGTLVGLEARLQALSAEKLNARWDGLVALLKQMIQRFLLSVKEDWNLWELAMTQQASKMDTPRLESYRHYEAARQLSEQARAEVPSKYRKAYEELLWNRL